MNKRTKNTDIDFTQTDQDIKAMQEAPKVYEKLKFGEWDWLVLEKHKNKALILSEAVIEFRRYHHTKAKITWADCELRSYLNNEFYASFSEDEKARIIQTKITTNTQSWYGTDGGMNTDDCIFLLSIEEVIKYFGDSGDMGKRKGWHWDGKSSLILKDGFGQFLNDQYNTTRIAKNTSGEAAWWRLRSPGRLHIFDVVVSSDGTIVFTGTPVEGDNGIRPAMWVSI